MASYLEPHISSDIKAATFALVGGGVLFVSLIPGRGSLNSVVNAFLSACGAFAAALAGWFWLDPLNRDIGLLWTVVGTVAFVIASAILVSLAARLWPDRFQETE